MTNSEWIQSAPGTADQKIAFLRCLDCHGLQRPIYSKDNAAEMAKTIQAWALHAACFAQFPLLPAERIERWPSRRTRDRWNWRPTSRDQFEFRKELSYRLKTQPAYRQVDATIVRPTICRGAAPHDTLRTRTNVCSPISSIS